MKVLITGGAGFIGSNAASRYLRRKDEVIVLDNLSRPGAARNLEWLKSQGRLTFVDVDIRDRSQMQRLLQEYRDVGLILHLAGQVAVTSSVAEPRSDFEINALGTLNVLEATRLAKIPAPLIFSSTNKVYGGMRDIEITESNNRYVYTTLPTGVSESRGLDFHSPYGCSKGAAEQYVRDYNRVYGINTVVFRQSCIFGTRQFGIEDQGWVAWFIIAALLERPLTIYGDGKQVRDVLFVDDLLDAFDLAASNIHRVAGSIYNIGGGPQNTLSLLELLSYIEARLGRRLPYNKSAWRPGDQRVFISDTTAAQRDLHWRARMTIRQGLDRLYDWINENRDLFSNLEAES
jgi:CDP-paratose 2-epimerase